MMRETKNGVDEPAFEYMQSLIGGGGSEAVSYRFLFNASATDGTNARALVDYMKVKIAAMVPKESEVRGSIVSFGGGGSGIDFSYMLRGDDVDELIKAGGIVKAKMKEIPGFLDVEDNLSVTNKEVEIAVDQNKARMYGLSSGQIIESMHSWLAEQKLGDLKFDNVTYNTKIMMDTSFTLLIVPIVYGMIENMKLSAGRLFHRKKAKEAPPTPS